MDISTYKLPDTVNLHGEMAEVSRALRRMTQSLAMVTDDKVLTQSNGLLKLADEAELLFKTSSLLVQQLKRRYRD